MEQESIGGLIRRFRGTLGMTQEELAHCLGITVSTVNRWENGHALPSRMARHRLAALADERGVHFGEAERRTSFAMPLVGSSTAAAIR